MKASSCVLHMTVAERLTNAKCDGSEMIHLVEYKSMKKGEVAEEVWILQYYKTCKVIEMATNFFFPLNA